MNVGAMTLQGGLYKKSASHDVENDSVQNEQRYQRRRIEWVVGNRSEQAANTVITAAIDIER